MADMPADELIVMIGVGKPFGLGQSPNLGGGLLAYLPKGSLHLLYRAGGYEPPGLVGIGPDSVGGDFEEDRIFRHIWLLESPEGTKSPTLS
jgi:hypothetical protein